MVGLQPVSRRPGSVPAAVVLLLLKHVTVTGAALRSLLSTQARFSRSLYFSLDKSSLFVVQSTAASIQMEYLGEGCLMQGRWKRCVEKFSGVLPPY